MGWQAELLKISHPPSDLPGTLDKALDRAERSLQKCHSSRNFHSIPRRTLIAPLREPILRTLSSF
jgi:hypothetical protein